MPLYEYECSKCHDRFERIQSFADAPVRKCPKCGGRTERLISAPAVQFKGSGWYATDYAKKSGAPEKSGDSASPDGAGAKSEGAKAAEKPAAKAESKGDAEKPAPAGAKRGRSRR